MEIILNNPWALREDSVMGDPDDYEAQSPKKMPSALDDPRDDQETIRRNYEEFMEETRRRSRMRTDEAHETIEYENIFLEGRSSGCASRMSECYSSMSGRMSLG